MSKSGIPEQSVLVLSELMGDNTQITRGVFTSLAEIEAYVYRFRQYEPETGEAILFKPLTMDTTDPDEYATSEIFIADALKGSQEVTEFFVWDSAKKREVYAPWKLYWCSVDFGGENAFVVAHTVAEAGATHTDNLGYDSTAQLVMVLPPALQQRQLVIGHADRELILACGARFSEDGVITIGGETFDTFSE